VFAGAVAEGGCVKAIRVPEGKRLSNSRLKPKGDVANEAVAAGTCARDERARHGRLGRSSLAGTAGAAEAGQLARPACAAWCVLASLHLPTV
jgi:hypothetical protein